MNKLIKKGMTTAAARKGKWWQMWSSMTAANKKREHYV